LSKKPTALKAIEAGWLLKLDAGRCAVSTGKVIYLIVKPIIALVSTLARLAGSGDVIAILNLPPFASMQNTTFQNFAYR